MLQKIKGEGDTTGEEGRKYISGEVTSPE